MAELETVEVSPAMRELIHRRTNWIAKDFIAYDRPLSTALANAYIAGMNDAIDVLTAKPRKTGPG